MTNVNAADYLRQTFQESLEIKEKFFAEQAENLVTAARWLGESLQQGGKLLICGNGGSAADAQHMAAEMVGRMLLQRRPLAAVALTTDTSNLTAIANDFGYDWVFSKQVEALARPGDLLLAISTSGNSPNVLAAVKAAHALSCRVIALTGGSGGKLSEVADLCITVSAGKNSSRIQESHLFAIHSMVDLHDRFFLDR